MSGPDPNLKTENGSFSAVCAAAATPPGESGLAVIRLSGPDCASAAAAIFRPSGQHFQPVTEMAGYTCSLGRVFDPSDGSLIDQVILTRFIAPHSYTGEDMVEISCHGSPSVKQAILDSLFRLGVLPAAPGEFTKRAFLNGKIDLAQAEAVMDLIQAGARKSSQAAASQLQGTLSRQVRSLVRETMDLLASVELILEYPEHEESEEALNRLAGQLDLLRWHTGRMADSYRQGRMLREGMTVVIAGRPNSGKSSLLNRLAGYDRAIVTPIPGTTRDTVEELVEIAGLPVRLVDTAGLRETSDEIEQLGVDRARAALRQADLVFWLFAPPLSGLDDEIDDEVQEVAAAAGVPLILVAGKDDLAEGSQLRQVFREKLPDYPVVSFSALTGEGLSELRQAIQNYYSKAGSPASEEVLITNSRHKACLERAADRLDQAAGLLRQGLTLDLAASLLRGCAENLAEITGDSVSEELVETIFSRFCIGK
jgi:tRNA modification GTPase